MITTQGITVSKEIAPRVAEVLVESGVSFSCESNGPRFVDFHADSVSTLETARQTAISDKSEFSGAIAMLDELADDARRIATRCQREPRLTPSDLHSRLSRYRYHFGSEKALQDGVERAMEAERAGAGR